MNLFKVALLDDNKEQVQLNKEYLEKLGNVAVVTACFESKSFLKEVKISKPDVLVLDLNLGDSYMNGMEVAYELKLPVIFVSSNTAQYVKEMEDLKREFSVCVDHLTKPFSENDFKKTMNRFLQEVTLFGSQQFVYLDFGSSKRNKILVDSIVYLSSDKANGSNSNNKQIHFTNRKTETLVDFSFTKMEEKGLFKTKFVTIHKAYRVNTHHIKSYCKKTETIEVDVYTTTLGRPIPKPLPVSENFQTLVKQLIK